MTDRGWLEALAARADQVLPAPMARYVAAGAGAEVTRDEAAAAWAVHRLLPRTLVDVSAASAQTSALGSPLRTPIGVAPTSLQRVAHPEGERAVAAAAAAAGALHVVSSNAGTPLDRLDAGGPWWLQLYVPPDRRSALPLVRRAAEGGATALVVTVDTPEPGPKHGVADDDWEGIDLSWHRMNLPPRTSRPWAADLVPDDLEWLAAETGLPIVAKGVLRSDDARRCVDAGVSGVWVSNHGGRQLDRSVTTAAALPAVADAVRGTAEVYVDGGLRSGLDVLTALALGADAVFLGRPVIWGLANDGSDGVRAVLDGLSAELVESMRLAGAPSVAATRSIGVITPGGTR